jgi:hypothetical protein
MMRVTTLLRIISTTDATFRISVSRRRQLVADCWGDLQPPSGPPERAATPPAPGVTQFPLNFTQQQ